MVEQQEALQKRFQASAYDGGLGRKVEDDYLEAMDRTAIWKTRGERGKQRQRKTQIKQKIG